MKKILLLFLLFASSVFCFGQLKGGFRAGANYSTFSGDSTRNYKYKFGYHGGAFGNYDLNGMTSVEFEVNYSSVGASYYIKTTQGVGNFLATTILDGSTTLNYIYGDLLLQIKTDAGVFFQGGVQPGYLLSALDKGTSTTTFSSSTISDSYSQTNPDSIGINRFDMAVCVGAGYALENGLSFGLRANLGIADISINSGNNDLRTHNLCFQFYAAFAFGGGGGNKKGSWGGRRRR